MTTPNYQVFNGLLNSDDLDQLHTILSLDDHKYKQARIFDHRIAQNVVDKSIRNANRITYRDPQLFNFLNQIVVKRINDTEEDCYYLLINNNVDVIKYNVGDFFKKHQDFIYYDSNAFKDYTFILSLEKCAIGGETLLYSDDDKYDSVKLAKGDVLLFKKHVIHEGKEIIDGQKIILSGNLICFPKYPDEESDFVIVNVSDKTFIIPVNTLKNTDSLYYRFYMFEKKQTPEATIFVYKEENVELTEFIKIYDIIMNSHLNDSKLLVALDYVNVKHKENYKYISELTQFINNSAEDIHLVTIDNYYKILKIFDECQNANELLPFQLITVELAKTTGSNQLIQQEPESDELKKFVIWMGLYNNLFATCDNYLMHCFEEEDFDHKPYEDNEREAYDKYANQFLSENPNMGQIKLIRDRLRDPSWKDESMIPKNIQDILSPFWTRFLSDDRELYREIRLYIWKYYSMTSIDDVDKEIYKNMNNDEKLNKFVGDLINKMDGSGGEGDPQYGKLFRKPLGSKQTDDIINVQFNKELLERLDINKMIERIIKVPSVSALEGSFVKEWIAKETVFESYNIIYRLGFMKISND
ncbi:MAG: prolyl 4-hydroxylase alpha subunit [Hyperionvirus sp.]|uniref:Prolyl 4-hydroxylase alpha subunit n=1 Tax=Hyperionvirus sp. TaxID=2487770 RepID=A0A3G5A8N2_9VIRU|nr:MAG: prolyl 4-hydroxylase alpha subunit [Hyperionvirus sp.]